MAYLSGIGYNNNATRNYVLGSGHLFNTRNGNSSKELWQEYSQMRHNILKRYPLTMLGEFILHRTHKTNMFTEISDRKY